MVRQLIHHFPPRTCEKGQSPTFARVWLFALAPVLTFCMLYSVPISGLPQLVYETQQDIERSGILYTVVGHAGDGE